MQTADADGKGGLALPTPGTPNIVAMEHNHHDTQRNGAAGRNGHAPAPPKKKAPRSARSRRPKAVRRSSAKAVARSKYPGEELIERPPPGSLLRTKRLLLAALRVWELKNGIHSGGGYYHFPADPEFGEA